LEKAVKAEIARQEQILSAGKKTVQETRGYNEVTGRTFSQRTKEEAQDYRYFPEPDIPPMRFTQNQILKIKNEIPELPQAKRERLAEQYLLPVDYIEILVQDKNRVDYFEEAVKLGADPKVTASAVVNQKLDSRFPEPAGMVRKLLELTQRKFVSEDKVTKAVTEILNENAKAVADYRAGKSQALGFLIGQVQKKLSGQGDPQKIKQWLIAKI
jgi:aspartyl-tRNA(Asn)/glutamyl-tRNA(Gln) amidotransferase subunit B